MASTVSGVLLTGVHGSRPSSGVTAGTLYACSTHALIYQTSDTGSTWATWATLTGTGLTDPMSTRGDAIVRNSSNVTARLAVGAANTYLGSDGTDPSYSAVTDAKLSTSDVTTNNVSTTKHGFAPKAPNDATKFLDGTGAYSVPAGGSAGALTFLEAHTASTSATLDFTTFISATYDDYMIELVDLHLATNNVNLLMRVGTGGGPTYDTGSNYAWSSYRWSSSGQAGGGSTGTTSFGLDGSGGIIQSANHGVSGQFRLFTPQSALYKRILGGLSYTDASSAPLTSQLSGSYLSTTALTAIRFLASSGNITDGTIRIYGVAKS